MSNGDPAVIEKRGKSNAARKGRYDGGYTGTEQRLKDKLMRPFMRTGEGEGGTSEAYRNASCWCACGRLISRDGMCERCLCSVPLGEHPESESVTVWSVTYVSDPRMEGRPPMVLRPDDFVSAEAPQEARERSAIALEPLDADGSLWRRTGKR